MKSLSQYINESAGSKFGDQTKYSKADFEQWCEDNGRDYFISEEGNIILVYMKLDQPIKKDGYEINIEHIATYDSKKQILYCDDLSEFV